LRAVTGSREVGETIGYQLGRLRRLRGFTQEGLADRADVSRDLVAKLEQGRRRSARITSLARLAAALDVEVSALLERAQPGRAAEDGDAGVVVAPRSGRDGSQSAPTSMAVALGARLPSDDDELREELREIDRSYGDVPSTSLLPAASRLLGAIVLLRDTFRIGRRRELDACEAEAATLMGQLVWDASQRRDHATACGYFDQAIAAARRVDDPIAAGHGVLRKGFIALYGHGDPARGLALAVQAAETTKDVSHALTGLSLVHAAEAHARLANRRDCELALAAAELHLGRITGDDSAAFLFAEPTLGRLAGSCYLSLGRYRQAESLLAETAQRLQDRPKSLAIVLANLALSHLRQRQVDAAAGVLHQAIDITARTRGGGGMNLVFGVGRELAPWRHEPVVQHVHDRLHDLMTQ
jgi:transcriptional regulator with XRE-family HTH domain